MQPGGCGSAGQRRFESNFLWFFFLLIVGSAVWLEM